MPIVQISRIQHRRGRSTDLPQLAAGELGWVIDEQRLYIGNGTVADGAPAVGNTEILTANSTSFSDAVAYVYKGYLGDATPIITGDGIDLVRTLQERLDDYVSVKAFGAVGNGSTNDTDAIQRALDELYCDIDKTDARSRRLLFFPAGQYNISDSIYIPPHAQLMGEGIDKTVIYQSGGNTAVAKMQDSLKQQGANIGNASATVPTNINIENITFKNGEAYAGVEIERASNIRFNNCKFLGTYAAGGADVANSKAVTVKSTTALPCSNIIFDSCQFTKFARLVDFSHDVTSAKFINCDFSTAHYGVIIGESTDGSTNGLTLGPNNVKILSSQFSSIKTNGIKVHNAGTIGNITSFNNFFASTVGTNGNSVDAGTTFPAILFNTDECVSELDYFELTMKRNSSLNPVPEVQGIGVNTRPVRQVSLIDNQSSAISSGIKIPALENKFIRIEYKIERGNSFRVGIFTVNVIGNDSSGSGLISYHDDYEENSNDSGIVLSATLQDDDSTTNPTSGDNDTVVIKYTTTSIGADATMDYRIIEIV